MDRRDLLGYAQPFRDLIDRPNVFDPILELMGPNIVLSMSQAIVRASTTEFPGFIHTDGGQALRQIRVTETSRPLAVKALYLLTDVEGRDNGNFTVFPGSHLRQIPFDSDAAPHPHTPGAVQLGGKAGDCYLFSHALWHGPGAQPFREGPQDTALQLRADVPEALRLPHHGRRHGFGARRASAGSSATSGTPRGWATSSTCPKTRRTSCSSDPAPARPPDRPPARAPQ